MSIPTFNTPPRIPIPPPDLFNVIGYPYQPLSRIAICDYRLYPVKSTYVAGLSLQLIDREESQSGRTHTASYLVPLIQLSTLVTDNIKVAEMGLEPIRA